MLCCMVLIFWTKPCAGTGSTSQVDQAPVRLDALRRLSERGQPAGVPDHDLLRVGRPRKDSQARFQDQVAVGRENGAGVVCTGEGKAPVSRRSDNYDATRSFPTQV